MAYSVRLMPRAEVDADYIYSWLAERSEEGAHRWWSALSEARERLALHPLNQAPLPEFSSAGHAVRQILFKTRHGRYYRLLYVVVENDVLVLRVRGAGEPDLTDDELD
jgi:plasmid stabilization system protein ParE